MGAQARSRNVLRARRWQRSDRNGGACAHEGAHMGRSPQGVGVAVAAVDEATGEFLERASFPQNRAGLRSLERWARRFAERRWAVENAGGLGVGTWREGWPRPANPWWTCRPSFRRG